MLTRNEEDINTDLCLFLCTVSFARKRVKVACVGNSITYGIGVSDPDKESYPAGYSKCWVKGIWWSVLESRELRC